MQAPNGQGCAISWHRDLSIAVMGDVLWRCVPIFREAIKKQKPVVFTLEPREEPLVLTHVPGKDTLPEKFRVLLNEALKERKLNYRLENGLVEVRGHFYGFRVTEVRAAVS